MRATVEALIARVLRLPIVTRLLAVVARYDRAGGGLLANGLAFATLFAAVPAVLLSLGLIGFLIDDASYQARLLEILSDAFPPLEPLFLELLRAVAAGSGFSSVIGAIGLVWAISQFYGTLDIAFARLFPGAIERDLLKRTLRGFATVAILALVVVAFVVLAWVTSILDVMLPEAFPAASAIRGVVTSPFTLLILTIAGLVFAYRILPPRRPAIRDVLLPAVMAGVAVAVLTQAFTFLAPRLVGATNVVGSLAAAFASLAWLSFAYQAVLLGAAWVAIRGTSHTATLASGTMDRDAGAVASGDPTADREDATSGTEPERHA
jgi:YihY family inner membrane protein